MTARFRTMRFIEIDAAHRIPSHSSKCRHMHGHRYRIEAHILGELAWGGAALDMAGGMDFSLIKSALMSVIDHYCDHGMILCSADAILRDIGGWAAPVKAGHLVDPVESIVDFSDYQFFVHPLFGRTYVIKRQPTAEALAEHWFLRLAEFFEQNYSKHPDIPKFDLDMVRVWETPNCYAEFARAPISTPS